MRSQCFQGRPENLVKSSHNRLLLIAERLDGVEPRRFPSGVKAKKKADADGNRVFLSLEPILKDALHIAQTEPKKIDRSTVVTALSLLGFGSI